MCFKSRPGLCLQSHPRLIYYQLLCLKSRPGLYLKKANSACVFWKIWHASKCTSSSIYKCFCICVIFKCAVFVFILINVQFYTEVILFVRKQNKETYMMSQFRQTTGISYCKTECIVDFYLILWDSIQFLINSLDLWFWRSICFFHKFG